MPKNVSSVKTVVKKFISATTLGSCILSTVPVYAQQTQRPPQFVLLAFDGSLSVPFWKESIAFSDKAESALNKPVKFTYFISGVYFLSYDTYQMYDAPGLGRGKSSIGFSGYRHEDTVTKKTEISNRVDEMNKAFDKGHEIGSHANGHFDANNPVHGKLKAQPWTQNDWEYEFRQFNDLIFNVFKNNNIQPSALFPKGLLFSQSNITGFRAPVLGVNQGLWPALKGFGFKYDTSKVNSMNYWPQKDKWGLWQFPLAELPIVGTGKKTLSMDFNFYVSQSGGVDATKSNPHLKDIYKKQMLDSYMNYFNINYYGNRAPIHIGHHFSKWNGGAYWDAMKEFAIQVCAQPEVKCVTYSEYMDWLERLPMHVYNDYRSGRFPYQQKPGQRLTFNDKPMDVQAKLSWTDSENWNKGNIRALLSGKNWNPQTMRSQFKIRNLSQNKASALQIQNKVKYQDLSSVASPGDNIEIRLEVKNNAGVDIQSATHVIYNFNTPKEFITTEPREARALMGDLPEAHYSEENEILP